jgi:hypothetical protein
MSVRKWGAQAGSRCGAARASPVEARRNATTTVFLVVALVDASMVELGKAVSRAAACVGRASMCARAARTARQPVVDFLSCGSQVAPTALLSLQLQLPPPLPPHLRLFHHPHAKSNEAVTLVALQTWSATCAPGHVCPWLPASCLSIFACPTHEMVTCS